MVHGIKKAKEYFAKYWSVGVMRAVIDLEKLGVEDPIAVLKKLEHNRFVHYKDGAFTTNKKGGA